VLVTAFRILIYVFSCQDFLGQEVYADLSFNQRPTVLAAVVADQLEA